MQQPELISYSGFTACGLSLQTSDAIEAQPATARVPLLWRRFYSEAVPARLSANASNGRVVCVYSSFENGALGNYAVTAGVQQIRDHACPSGLVRVSVSSGEYLRFTTYGTGQAAIAQTWQRIHEFFAHAEHSLAGRFERAYTADFERYGDPDSVSVFIAVKRKLGVHRAAEHLRRALRPV